MDLPTKLNAVPKLSAFPNLNAVRNFSRLVLALLVRLERIDLSLKLRVRLQLFVVVRKVAIVFRPCSCCVALRNSGLFATLLRGH
jgi:hypothetical protein